MEDSMVMQAGTGVANQALEVLDDIIQALIAALQGNDTEKQREVLNRFSEHIKEGGSLDVCRIDPGKLDEFQEAAKKEDLTYYAVMDDEAGKVNVIVRDNDADAVRGVAYRMDAEGEPLYEDPQLNLSEFIRRYGDEGLAYSPLDSYSRVEDAKINAVSRGVNFSVAKRNDNSLMVIYRMKDMQDIYKSGVVDKDAKMKLMVAHTGLQDVRGLVQEKKDQMAREREEEKEKKKNRGRE